MNDENRILFSGIEESLSNIESCIRSTRRELMIFSKDLPPSLYDKSELNESLTSALSHQREMMVRILLNHSANLIGLNPKLKRLTQRLPSRIEVRTIDTDSSPAEIDFIVADRRGIVEFTEIDTASGIYRPELTHQAKEYHEAFQECWQKYSKPVADLRRLYI